MERKICGQCLIYAPDLYGEGCNGCSLKEYEGEVLPDREACGRYIRRSDLLSRLSHGEVAKPDDNSKNLPVRRYWAKDHDISTGEVSGVLPYCPSCNSLTFGEDSCEYCGQPFLLDEITVKEFSSWMPQLRDCPFCKSKDAYHYVRHGKTENGKCTECGTVVFDYPYDLAEA